MRVKPFKTALVAAAVVIAAPGCIEFRNEAGAPALTADASGSAGVATGRAIPPTGAGFYLAGRYAQKQNDFLSASDYLERALAANPENTLLRRRTFIAKLSAGRVPEAMAHARIIAAGSGSAPIARLAMVVDAVERGDLDLAETELEKFPTRGISSVLKPLLLSWVKVEAGEADEALAVLEPLKKQSALGVLYQLHAAMISDALGREASALDHYLRARDTARRATLRVVQALGRHYERTGRVTDAEALYAAYVRENPESVVLQPELDRIRAGRKPDLLVPDAKSGVSEALFNIASTMTRENSAQVALLYARLSSHLRPDFDLAQMLVAGILESMDRYEEAIAAYESVSEASPLRWSARLRIAGSLEALERDNDAVVLLTALAQEDPSRADPLVNLGDLYRANKQFGKSVEAYDRAIEVIGDIDQRHWSVLYSRGIALERSKNWNRAEKDFQHALKLNPEQPYVLNYLGYSWVDQGINLAEARKMIERAVELRPDDGYIVDSLGWVLYRLKDFEGAVSQLERAVELRPQDPTINDHLGDAYWQVGRKIEARFQWKRALALEPEPEQLQAIEDKVLRGLTDTPAAEKDS